MFNKLEFSFSEKARQIRRNLPQGFDVPKPWGRLRQIFVASSEKLNFTACIWKYSDDFDFESQI